VATIDPNAGRKIDAVIERAAPFARPICRALRRIIRRAAPGIVEDWKWGPNFNHEGMVCGLWPFQKHVSLVFFKGALLKDPEKILTHGGGNARNRTVKFTSIDEVDERTLTAYVREAVRLNVTGAKVEPARKSIRLHPAFRRALAASPRARAGFEKLAHYCRKEYAEWIAEAGKPETRERRLTKAIAMIAAGRGLNDRYR
jgi:hypothetical protein